MELEDTRLLSYAEWGDPRGQPVFFFHGAPGSRLFRHPDDRILTDSGIRLITVDRPGFGLSDFRPGRGIPDWPADVVQLADVLDLERFAVVGFSAGGPYVAACAAAFPERITRAAIVSGNGPPDRPRALDDVAPENQELHHQFRRSPKLVEGPLRGMIEHAKTSPEKLVDAYAARAPDADRAVLAEPAIRSMVAASYREAARRGPDGFIWEFGLLARPWRVPLDRITRPVDLWYGEEDRACPPQMGRFLNEQIPGARLRVLPGEGHFSMVLRHWKELLTTALAPTDMVDARSPGKRA